MLHPSSTPTCLMASAAATCDSHATRTLRAPNPRKGTPLNTTLKAPSSNPNISTSKRLPLKKLIAPIDLRIRTLDTAHTLRTQPDRPSTRTHIPPFRAQRRKRHRKEAQPGVVDHKDKD